jgi:hypothetical protein
MAASRRRRTAARYQRGPPRILDHDINQGHRFELPRSMEGPNVNRAHAATSD